MSTKREREEQENNADVILVPATKRADSSEGSVPAHEGEEPKNGHEMHGEGVARNTKESMTVFDGALDPQQGDKNGGENKGIPTRTTTTHRLCLLSIGPTRRWLKDSKTELKTN